MLVVSTGCPCSVGPEIAVRAASKLRGGACVLVGDERTLLQAAELVGVRRERLRRWPASAVPADLRGIFMHQTGPELPERARRPGKPGKLAGRAQLAYVEEAFRLCQSTGAPLVTAAVSKAAIVRSGDPRAQHFRGHTEWLQAMSGAGAVTMCFWTPRFSTSLVTTHLPLQRVPAAITEQGVTTSILHLVELLHQLTDDKPRIAVCSLNPHAGEEGLFGSEEKSAILPGIARARRACRRRARVSGPVGAETAYRRAASGEYDGVVAMYHDQATIPTKLSSFGKAVNVTMGLGFIRTSVDHGTAYDIAWRGEADVRGMSSALRLAVRLASAE